MGKHIIISREGGDFSMDLIFAGLVRRFGKENVIDWPPRSKHRQGKPFLVDDDEKDYGAERRSLCYVDGCEDMKQWTLEEIVKDAGMIDRVWLDEADESYEHWLELAKKTIGLGINKNVVIAGHDTFRGNPVDVKSRFGHSLARMFVDDWQPQYDNYNFMSLINLSCNFDHLWDVENREKYLADKKYDICFIGYNSNPVRKLVIDHVKKRWGHLNNCIIFEERQDKFDKFIRHDEMFKLIAQSKICLNLPGASTNGRALRYYEIPYVGSYMLTMKTPTVYIEPRMGIDFTTLESLDRKIEDVFERGISEIVADTSHRRCMARHTIDARMDYIFGVLDEK